MSKPSGKGRTAVADTNYDLIVKSSVILTPEGRVSGIIAVNDEKIAAILPSDAPVSANKVVDAGDRPVIPGLIDTHAHFRDPGYTHKEDYYHGTIAAAA